MTSELSPPLSLWMVYREAVDDVSTSRMKKHRTVYEIRKVPDVPLQLGSLPVPKQ